MFCFAGAYRTPVKTISAYSLRILMVRHTASFIAYCGANPIAFIRLLSRMAVVAMLNPLLSVSFGRSNTTFFPLYSEQS